MRPNNPILAASCASLAALLIATAAAGPALSAPDSGPGQQSHLSMAEWQAETTIALNRLLGEAPAPRLTPPNSALVEVAFSIGGDGMAKDIELLEGDGNWSAKRAALFAVRRLDTLARIPVAQPMTTRLIAYLVFYRTLRTRQRLLDLAQARAAERKHRPGKYQSLVAIGLGRSSE